MPDGLCRSHGVLAGPGRRIVVVAAVIDLLVSVALGAVLLAGCVLLLAGGVVPAAREARRVATETRDTARAGHATAEPPSPDDDRGEQ